MSSEDYTKIIVALILIIIILLFFMSILNDELKQRKREMNKLQESVEHFRELFNREAGLKGKYYNELLEYRNKLNNENLLNSEDTLF